MILLFILSTTAFVSALYLTIKTVKQHGAIYPDAVSRWNFYHTLVCLFQVSKTEASETEKLLENHPAHIKF